MSRIVCPFCGPRELEEFHFHKTLPEPGATAIAEVYARVNRIDSSAEHWQHLHGCRAWLLVRRNPTTGQVLELGLGRDCPMNGTRCAPYDFRTCEP